MKIRGIVCGNCNDGNILQLLQLSNAPRGRQSIDNGQAEIHQDHIRHFSLRYSHGFYAICGLCDVVAAHFQQSSHHRAVIFGVLNEQHAEFRLRAAEASGVSDFRRFRFHNQSSGLARFKVLGSLSY